MVEEFSKWDMADDIRDAEDVEAYLIGCIARSKGMTEFARRTGLNRVSLYNSFGEHGNPSLDSTMRVLDALGYRLRVERKDSPRELATA